MVSSNLDLSFDVSRAARDVRGHLQCIGASAKEQTGGGLNY